MTEPPYWEYRIWPETPDEIYARLISSLRFEPDSRRIDAYFLFEGDTAHQAKLRDSNRMSVKTLLAVERDCERWQTVMEAPMPLDQDKRDELARLFPAIAGRLQQAEDLRAVLSDAARRVEVLKVRQLAMAGGGLRAEMTVAGFGSHHRHTFCLEHARLDALCDGVEAYGFSDWPNVNYPAFLTDV